MNMIKVIFVIFNSNFLCLKLSTMKKYLIPGCIVILSWACNGGAGSNTSSGNDTTAASTNKSSADTSSSSTASASAEEDAKGIGKFTHIDLPATIDKSMVAEGQKIYDLKCSSCHHLDNTKLVGPGWKGVTERRKPEWIMNFVTNTDENLDRNATAQTLLEECMVRMPNQNLSDDDARHVLEFMRNNDAK
jgi:cytochrome c551/c552